MIDTAFVQEKLTRLLTEIGTGWMLNTAYDTAWVARLAEHDKVLGESALEWLRAHQLPDGSWGTENPRYYHDRLICTMAAMAALAKYGTDADRHRWQRARLALRTLVNGLQADPTGATVGFEMIAPTLLSEARTLGLVEDEGREVLEKLERYRAAKIAALPSGMVNRFVTVAFSSEMVGPDGIHLLDVDNLQESNGSLGHSPSATAYFLLHVRPDDPAALAYLRQVASDDGGVPNVAPFDVFEQAWTLWNLMLLGDPDEDTRALCQPHLDFLNKAWVPGVGIGHAIGYTPKDGDDTGLVFEVLTRYGSSVDMEAVRSYEEDDHYRCFALESNSSISANIHVLGALREAGLPASHPSVRKVIGFLDRVQTIRLFWFDKWHTSPYYTTSHLVIVAAGYADDLIDNAAFWIMETQNADGSWGYYMPTGEETAYCLQALVLWKRAGHKVPDEVLQRGANWLMRHIDDPVPPLWIGKCLYAPVQVVRSAIYSALLLVAQG